MGFSRDFDFQTISLLVEASKRFGDNMKIALELRAFSLQNSSDPLYSLRRDNQLQLSAQYFY